MSEALSETNQFQANLSAYRQSLLEAEKAMQASFDRSVLTLSGGALAISIAFLKDVIPGKPVFWGPCLITAWVLWAISITVILCSFFTSTLAIREAIKHTDMHTIYMTDGKSFWATATKWLNAVGGLGFVAGVVFLVLFTSRNLPHQSYGKETNSPNTPNATSTLPNQAVH